MQRELALGISFSTLLIFQHSHQRVPKCNVSRAGTFSTLLIESLSATFEDDTASGIRVHLSVPFSLSR